MDLRQMTPQEIVARTLMGEAGREGAEGMLAAAAVMDNRRKSNAYGNTFHDVILQPGQFSLYNDITGYAGGQGANKAWQGAMDPTAWEVAGKVVSGDYSDPTGGATHYYNPRAASPSWANGKPYQDIGNHRFLSADAGAYRGGDTTMRGGQGNDTLGTKGAPMGLLNMQEQPQTFGQRVKAAWQDGSLMDGIAFAANSLRRNPNEDFGRMLLAKEATRNKDAKDAKQQNKTVAWLRASGFGEWADAVESGALTPQQAIQFAMQKPDQTALQQNYEYALSLGMSPEEARAWVKGGQTINVNTGANGINYGDPESGTVWKRNADGSIVLDERGAPIALPYQGGSAWRKEQEAEAEKVAAETASVLKQNQKVAQADTVTATIGEMREIMKKNGPFDILPETGIIGGRLGKWGLNQEAADLHAKAKVLQAHQAFGSLQRMRDASKTGGALGAVSERELDLLAADLGSLDTITSEPEFKKVLNRIEATYTKILNDPVASSYVGGGYNESITVAPLSDDEMFSIYGVSR